MIRSLKYQIDLKIKKNYYILIKENLFKPSLKISTKNSHLKIFPKIKNLIPLRKISLNSKHKLII